MTNGMLASVANDRGKYSQRYLIITKVKTNEVAADVGDTIPIETLITFFTANKMR